jgi:hypothetical protein
MEREDEGENMRKGEIEIVKEAGRENNQAGIRRPSRLHSSEVPARTTQTASAHTPPLPFSPPGASPWSTALAGWEAAAAVSGAEFEVWMIPAERAAVSPRGCRTSSLPTTTSALAFGLSSSGQRQVSRPATMPTASGEQARSDTLSSTVSSSSPSSFAAAVAIPASNRGERDEVEALVSRGDGCSESPRTRLLSWLRPVLWLLLTFPRRGAGHLLAVPHCGLPPRKSLLLLLLLLERWFPWAGASRP